MGGVSVRACEGHNSFGLGQGRTAARRWGLGSQVARIISVPTSPQALTP